MFIEKVLCKSEKPEPKNYTKKNKKKRSIKSNYY